MIYTAETSYKAYQDLVKGVKDSIINLMQYKFKTFVFRGGLTLVSGKEIREIKIIFWEGKYDCVVDLYDRELGTYDEYFSSFETDIVDLIQILEKLEENA